MPHQIGFLLREAFRSLRADRFLSLTSVITIGVCSGVMAVLLLGLVSALALNRLGTTSDAPLRVFTRPGSEQAEDLVRLRAKLEKLGEFDSVVFVSKDDALQEFRRDFGEEMLQYLEINPLPHSFKLYPSEKPLSAARIQALRAAVGAFEEVEETSSDAAYLQWLDRWRLPTQAAMLLLLGFLGGALALIVNNAIRVSLYARRALVENMKYCGASEAFILTPFVLEGVLLGLGGSLAGVAVLAVLGQLIRFLSPTLAERISFDVLAALLVAGAALIALFSSWRTVRAFFRGYPA